MPYISFTATWGGYSKNNLDFLFSKSNSLSGEKGLEKFEGNEKEALEILEKLFKNLNEILQNFLKNKLEKFQSIEETFQKISQQEEKLKKSYEENQKDLEDLKKQNENLTSVLKNKLDTQSKEEQMKRVGESIHRFNRMLYSWGGFLEKIICHINSEGKGDEKCKNVEDSWLKSKENIEKGKQDKNRSQEGNSDDSQGKIASQKLQEVKGEFLDNQVKIREKLIEGILFWKKSEKLEKQLETMQIILKTDVELLNQLIEKLQKKMKEKAEEAKNTVDELNKSYESLRTTYKELEEVKEQVVNFNHYVGKVKNSMCKNSQYKDSESSCAPNSQ